MKTNAFRSPIAPSPSGKRNGFARHRRGQGIPNGTPTLWVKWSHLNSWQTAGNTIAVSVEVAGVTWSGFIVRICQKVYICRGSKPAKAEDSVNVGWSYYLLPASFPALGIQKPSKKCWNTVSIRWKRKGCALRTDACTNAINWQHVLLKSRKKCLSLSLSPSEETCWHIFTYLADQYPQVSPLPRPKWSECLWKRWGGGQCSHVPAIVSASYLKALGIAHLLHELGRGQNLFGEQRPISCTIKLVPLWHWHMEGEKFCGLGRISNDVAWHRYNLLKLMYLNVDKTLYTHTHMDSRGHSSCQEADRTILKALSIPAQVDCDRTWPDHVRHTPQVRDPKSWIYWTNLESMVTKQRPWCIVQGTQDNIWHLHSPQIPAASHVSAENTWIRQ